MIFECEFRRLVPPPRTEKKGDGGCYIWFGKLFERLVQGPYIDFPLSSPNSLMLLAPTVTETGFYYPLPHDWANLLCLFFFVSRRDFILFLLSLAETSYFFCFLSQKLHIFLPLMLRPFLLTLLASRSSTFCSNSSVGYYALAQPASF